ncbi:MAG: hypothetical protein K0U64_12805, partial [Actinomycetia bacterium]|nr:hypothetical protein [Actinomycetes bacterium]
LTEQEPDDTIRQAYGEAYDFQINQLAKNLSKAGGYEETLRQIAPLTRSGYIDQEDVDALMPLITAQARKPLPDLLNRESLIAAGVAIPQSIGDLIKGGVGIVKYGVPAIPELIRVMGHTGDVPGTPVKPGEGLESVWRRSQEIRKAAGGTPALDVLEASAIQGTYESARLAQRLGRTLFSDMNDYTDDAIRERFNRDLKAFEFFTAIEDGTAYPDMSPEDIEYIQSIGEIADLTNFIPFGIGLKVAKKGSKVAASLLVGAKGAAKDVAVGTVRKSVGDIDEYLGKRAGDLSQTASKSPTFAGGITLALSGDLTAAGVAALTAATKEGSSVVARIIGAPAKVIEATGRGIKKPITGPTAAATALLKDYGIASLYGAGAMVPFASVAETPEEAGTLIGGGAGAGSLGAVTGQTVGGFKSFGQNLWAPSKGAPANAPRAVITSYGTIFDIDHETYVNGLDTDEVNRIEALRDLIGPNNRLYVLSPEAYDALPNLEGTNGVANFKDEQGVNTTLVRGKTESLLHETGHVVVNSLDAAQKNDLYESVRKAYGAEGLQQMRDYYESLGVTLPNDVALVEEILAENFQVALNGGPLSNFGTPRSLAAKIYSLFGETAENLGLRDLKMGGNVVTSETLQYTPSFLVQKAIRNVMDAINLDDAAPIELKTANGTVTRVPQKTPTEVDVGVATKVPVELLEQSPIPVPGSISGVPVSQKPPTKQRPAPVAPETGGYDPSTEPTILSSYMDEKGNPIDVAKLSVDELAELRDRHVKKMRGKAGLEDGSQSQLLETTSGQTMVEELVQILAEQQRRGIRAVFPKEIADIVAPNRETPAPTPTTPAPAPTTERPNVRVTRGQQEEFVPPTPEQQASNTQRLQELADRPRAEQAYVETDYFAAKPVTGTEPNAKRRLAQRQLADTAEAKYPGYSNPLRSAFQKIFAPYKNLGGNKIIGFSFDKLIQNLDILAGWVGEQITAGNNVQMPYDLSSPDLRRDIQTYLQNHANGYAGNGRRLARPVDTAPGTITDENPNYTPVPLEPVKAQFINLLMGMEPPKKTTAAAEFNRRFALVNGLAITETPTGSPEVNV